MDQSIHATWPRKYLTLAAISLLKHFRPRQSAVLMLTSDICVKYGPFQHLSSAVAMKYIAENTTLPLPTIYCAFERKGFTYIVMSRIPGSPIGHRWKQRPQKSKARLLGQLRRYVEEMRSLRPPKEDCVQAADGGKLYDSRLLGGLAGFGPFNSIGEFHFFLRSGASSSPEQFQEVNELVEMHNTTTYSTRFTHGDLSSMNILVRDDNIVGIVDWDTAGWLPEYWEYTSASNVNVYNEFWKVEIPRFLQEYPEALHMESLRQKYFADF